MIVSTGKYRYWKRDPQPRVLRFHAHFERKFYQKTFWVIQSKIKTKTELKREERQEKTNKKNKSTKERIPQVSNFHYWAIYKMRLEQP